MREKSLVVILVLSLSLLCDGLIHDLHINDDKRQWFFIENFGFTQGGKLDMTINNFLVGGEPLDPSQKEKVGFVIKRTETDSTAFVEENPGTEDQCEFIWAVEDVDIAVKINVDSTNKGNYTHHEETIKEGQEGFYNTYFINCLGEPISFELILKQYNVDASGTPNYLSVGYSPLPTLYGIFTLFYVGLLIVWIMNFIRASNAKINRIHHLMTIFIILKLLSLLFKTIEQHYLKTGGIATGWNYIYYIFAGMKGVMLFVLIALIGTGWSFVKPFLSDKDKKIFMVVIPLQLLDNIALIVVEETAPGSQGWFTWKDIFRLVDIICCGAILIPIIWSIKHLREASAIDGKAARNMNKLKLFRQFYIMVVSYIYFTRIIVYLVDATLPFRLVWLGDLFLEGATIIFFTITGYKFRPTPDNPYFALELEDVDGNRQEKDVPL